MNEQRPVDIDELLGDPEPENSLDGNGRPWLWSYWEGPTPPPVIELCKETISKYNPSFRELNPESVRAVGGGAVLDFMANHDRPDDRFWGPPQRSDLLRWWLLWKFGGVWLDTDYICFKPMDMLDVCHDVDLVGCHNPHKTKGFGQAMLGTPFGARPGSPIMKWAFENCFFYLLSLFQGEDVKYGMTSVGILSRIYKEAAKTTDYTLDRREHWRYHRVPWEKVKPAFMEKGKSWKFEYGKWWVPGACSVHITNVMTDTLQDATRDELLDMQNYIGFLFNRALGLPGKQSMMGRSYEIIQRLPTEAPTVCVEVGVFRGRNARAVLQQRPLCDMLLVDPWGDNGNEDRWANSKDARANEPIEDREKHFEFTKKHVAWAGDRVTIQRTVSVEAAKGVDDDTVDVVFIDAEHTYDGVKEDIEAWWPKVKAGGWIGGHDYSKRWGGVRTAVDEFANALGVPLVRGEDDTWWLRRPNDG